MIKILVNRIKLGDFTAYGYDNYTLNKIAKDLETISLENDALHEKVISALLQLIQTPEHPYGCYRREYGRWQAIETLGRIGIGNKQVISALIQRKSY